MDRDPGDFPRDEPIDFSAPPVAPPKPFGAMTDDELEDWMAKLPPPRGWDRDVEEDEADLLRAEARAMQDHREGRSYPHAIVSEWLMTWGKPDRKTFHQWLADRDG